jgi:hypothetical protein
MIVVRQEGSVSYLHFKQARGPQTISTYYKFIWLSYNIAHMKLTSYETLLEGREKYLILYERLGLGKPRHNRILQAYKLIEGLIPAYKDTELISIFLAKYNNEQQVDYALVEILELNRIIDMILEGSIPATKLVAEKIRQISEGTLSPVIENPINSLARNTAFELSLMSDFLSVGMNAELKEKNPDILLSCKDNVYHIECKRILSSQQLSKEYKKAMIQLDKQLRRSSLNNRGVVALSVNHLINEPSYFLESETPRDGYTHIDNVLTDFIYKNRIIWQNTSRPPGRKVPGVILHYSTILFARTGVRQSSLTFRTITNTHTDDLYFDELKRDILPLMSIDSYSNT